MNTLSAPGSGAGSEVDVRSLRVEEVDRPCSICDGRFAGTFFRVNGKATCEPCARIVSRGRGGPLGRAIGALSYGLITAGLAAVVWGVIAWASGYEPTFLPVVVGFFVGGAVRTGSRARGGFGYQMLAMVLTYAAVCAAYVPAIAEDIQHTPYVEIMGGLRSGQEARIRMLYLEGGLDPKSTEPAAREAAWADALLAGALDGDSVLAFENEDGEPVAAPEVTDGERIQVESAYREFAAMPIGEVVDAALPRVFAAPLMTKGAAFYILIASLAAGLWLAWRRSHRARSIVTGPFDIGGATR